jgi:hypothetical protein
MNSRRSFFHDLALLSALAGIAEREGLAQAKDDKLSNFWDAYFEEAERDPNQISRGANDADLMDPSKKVELIHATDSGLIYTDSIDNKQLMAESDVVLTLTPAHFRPSPDDRRAISRSRGCQIRVDCIQTRPIINLIAPMAWAGLAAWSLDKTTQTATKVTDLQTNPVIDPKTGKQKISVKTTAGPTPPELAQLDFTDPNSPTAPAHDQVVLMGGSGRLALNVRGVSANNRLQGILDKSVQYSSLIAPFFGFAPLAIPALRAFTTLLGAVFNHESVIMNSMPQQIVATQDALKNPHDTSAMKVVSGAYIAVPANQTGDLKGSLDQLRVVNGWLVHQDSPKDVPVEQRAQDQRVPRVTYMSVSLNVQSLQDAQMQKGKGG